MLSYVRYSRKSSESRERQALSISEQNAECENLILREKLSIAYRFDEEKTAYKPGKRIKFEAMIDLIKSGKVNAILTWKEDRLCRNPEEGGKVLQLLQDGLLKEIRTISGGIYTPDSDHLILQIHFGMANQYSRNLSQNVRRGYKYKVQRGEYPRPAFYGYENYGIKGTKNIRLHSFAAPIIKEMFRLATNDQYSISYLQNFLYERGLRTKKGNRIMKSSVYRILTNNAYYGYFLHLGELYKGSYEALITKEQFDAVQAVLKNRSKPKFIQSTFRHPYNGLLKCATCGCSITTTIKTKKYERTNREATYTYHHCTKKKIGCTQEWITHQKLNEELSAYIGQITISEDIWKLGIELLRAKHKSVSDTHTNQTKQYEIKYHQLQNRLNALIDMRANGELTKDEFLFRKQLLLEEQAQVEGLILDAKGSSRDWLELTEKFLDTAFHAREIMESGDLDKKKELILSVGENLKLNNGKVIFTFKAPFDYLLKPGYRSDMRSQGGSNPQPLP